MAVTNPQTGPGAANAQLGSLAGQPYRMQPRINLRRDIVADSSINMVTRLFRRSSESDECDNNDKCGRPLSPNATTVTIVLGVM